MGFIPQLIPRITNPMIIHWKYLNNQCFICPKDLDFTYSGIPFCRFHLNRFLKKRNLKLEKAN